jgi:hypothetical protein
MPTLILIVTGLLCAFQVSAVTEEALIKNLKSRIHDLPKNQGSLIKSFDNHTQSYIYDQALAIIAFSKSDDKGNATKLMNGLKSLQMSDGSLYFSYYMNGVSPYPTEGDRRIAGAIAWVAMAASHYQHQFKSDEFKTFNLKILHYLKNQMTAVEIKGLKTKAVRFAPHDIPSTPFAENDVIALEHNLDAYSAFTHYGKINKTDDWQKSADELKSFILQMWDKRNDHFWSGAMVKDGVVAKSELYLDNQTWSLLALDNDELKQISTEKALRLNCEEFFVKKDGISGFMDSKPSNRPSKHSFIWSEGTLGQILAMKKVSQIQSKEILCNDMKAEDFLLSIKKMKQNDGGIAYATPNDNPDFTTGSSVAGTAWLYFALGNINPFQLN